MTTDRDSTPTQHRRSWPRLKEYSMLAALLVVPERWRARAFFELRGDRSRLTEKSSYRNMGYWKDDPGSLDEASQALADLLGEAAGLGPEGTVLDVGCGFAEQDVRWVERFSPHKIVGLDLVPSQVEAGRRRMARLGLTDRVDLRVGSATSLPFGPGSFDQVVALECALHFVTREDFFREARRVLRPHGTLALVDPVTTGGNSGVHGYLERALGAIPRANAYSTEVYAEKLRQCGFVNVRVQSLRDEVYGGFAKYLARRLDDPEVAGRMNAALRVMWLQWVQAWQATTTDQAAYAGNQDYILVVAEAPGQNP
jgi:erythromycin 3''-O-methyltransferase